MKIDELLMHRRELPEEEEKVALFPLLRPDHSHGIVAESKDEDDVDSFLHAAPFLKR